MSWLEGLGLWCLRLRLRGEVGSQEGEGESGAGEAVFEADGFG